MWTGSKVPPRTPMRIACPSPCWVLARSGARLDCRIDRMAAQYLGSLLRRHWVNIEPRSPLKSRHAREPWDDLEMPVIVRQCLRIEGRRVDDVVVCRIVQRRFQLEQNGFENGAQFVHLGLLNI